MTDAELRDAAISYLKKTTVGWNKVSGYSAEKLAGTNWGKAMAALSQIGEVAPPPSTGSPIPTNGIISAGGLYSGSFSGSLSIQTSDPVLITNTSLSGLGTIIQGIGSDLTLDHVSVTGGSGRFIALEEFRNLVVRNCSIEKTSGISLVHGQVGAVVSIIRNRHHNIQRSGVGNFVQFNEVQNPQIEIAWNEIINDFGQSDAEDLISIYKSAHGIVHDNYFQHQSSPGNAPNSGTGMMLENGDNLGSAKSDYWDIHDNQWVDTLAAVIIYSGVGGHITISNNRCVQDGFLPDGTTRIAGGYSGFANLGPNTNTVSMNVCGFVNKDGGRVDWDPRSSTSWSGNTSLPSPITRQMELDEWSRWQQKLSANSIVIGA